MRICIILFDLSDAALGPSPSRTSAGLACRKEMMPRTSATTVAIIAATRRMDEEGVHGHI